MGRGIKKISENVIADKRSLTLVTKSESHGLVDNASVPAGIMNTPAMPLGMLNVDYGTRGLSVKVKQGDNDSYSECTDDLNRVCGDLAASATDPALAFSQISDDQLFVEMKSAYAKEMVTGFIKLNGLTVGAVGNRTELFDEEAKVAEKFDSVITANGADKAADFVKFCDAFSIPVLTFTNATGFKACKCQEKRIAKALARMTYAFACASVPKVNVVTGKAYGTAYSVMNSKAVGADTVFAWEGSEIGTMDAALAAKIMYADEISKAKDANAVINEKAAEYRNLQNSAESAASRGYVDTMIAPEDTRKYVIGAFEMLFTKREECPAKKHGTI